MPYRSFEDLEVWKKACSLAVRVYEVLQDCRDYRLRDQMTGAAVSIPSNIAEGDERDTDKEAVRYFYISKGSLAELQTQIQIAYEIGYLEKEHYKEIENKCKKIGSMIGELIKFRQRTYSQ